MKTNATCTLLQQSTHYLIHCLSVSFSLSLFLHVWWSTQGWGATFSERDCTDVNDILLVLSATSYTSPWEGTGSIDRRAGVKSRTGILQSGSQALTALSVRNSSPKHQHLLVQEDLFGYTTKNYLKKTHLQGKSLLILFNQVFIPPLWAECVCLCELLLRVQTDECNQMQVKL